MLILYLTELGNLATIPARVLANILIWYTAMSGSSLLVPSLLGGPRI